MDRFTSLVMREATRGEVYRVRGSRLGNGAYLLAESEQEAIKVAAGVFKLDEASLKAAPDKTVGLPSNTKSL